MKILAIDTSSSICSTAILENDIVIDENNLDNGRTHSENLMLLVDELLRRNNIKIEEIELLACAVGPGSFTGIRIGVATVKPIAEVLNIKVASVNSLEGLARNVEKGSNTIVSMIDAKNNQVYCGIFDEEYNQKDELMADDINIILDKLKKYENITFVGNGAELHKNLIIEKINNCLFSENNSQSAANFGKIAYKKYLNNNLETADTLVPLYLRKSQAERLKNR